MLRTYAVNFSKVAVSAAVDLFEFAPADDKAVELCGLFIAQSSDFGDAQAEVIPYKVIRGHATSGSGGSTPVKPALDPNDTAAGFTAEANNTTVASAGTPFDIHTGAFNVAAGEQIWFPEGFGPRTTQTAGLLVVRLATAPADSIEISATAYVRET